MSDLWLPWQQRREVVPLRQELDADTMAQVNTEMGRQLYHARRLVRDLQEKDPHLDLAFANEKVDHPHLKPNRWHLLRKNPDAPVTAIPLETAEGGYLEPGGQMEALIGRMDLWSGSAERDRREARLRAEKAAERARDRQREDLVEEVADRIKAKIEPGVSFSNRGRGWKNRAGARTERKAA